MKTTEHLSYERLQVLENIARAASEGNYWKKVEISDHHVTREERERLAARFDNDRRSPLARMRASAASRLADGLCDKFNKTTSISGVENALEIGSGAVITSNHYTPADSTPIRMLTEIMGRKKDLHIMIQEANMFMGGAFGFLMRNCNTHPYIPTASYVTKKFMPSMQRLLAGGGLLLVYPEAEMWFNYKKPRQPKDGAYHIAASFGVPVLPTFTELITIDGERDNNGFLPVRRVLHILPPIYPDPEASLAENRAYMMNTDYRLKKSLYQRLYGKDAGAPFDAKSDIAGV